ncbi:MAG: NADH-quinone oxidoreductase subunit A [Thermoproteota archaeon]|jgi:NADH-quinone oxidoreductase subunit A
MFEFIPLAIALIVSAIIAVAMVIINYLLVPPSPKDEIRFSPYECGEEVIGEAQVRMNVQYYVYGIAYLITDILAVTVIIWAFYQYNFTLESFVALAFLAFSMLFGVFYTIKKGLLRWV